VPDLRKQSAGTVAPALCPGKELERILSIFPGRPKRAGGAKQLVAA
jgi:hypothetical protein